MKQDIFSMLQISQFFSNFRELDRQQGSPSSRSQRGDKETRINRRRRA